MILDKTWRENGGLIGNVMKVIQKNEHIVDFDQIDHRKLFKQPMCYAGGVIAQTEAMLLKYSTNTLASRLVETFIPVRSWKTLICHFDKKSV